MNDVSFKAHIYGQNNYIAYSIALSNAFASKKDKKTRLSKNGKVPSIKYKNKKQKSLMKIYRKNI